MSSESTDHLNPFPGLRPFSTEEDFLFFGREAQTTDLLGLLREHRFLAVVGTSGSGKSSLVRAGLLPALHGGTMTQAGSSWEVLLLRPGGNPIANLARSMLDADLYDPDDVESLPRLIATLNRSRSGLVEAVRQSDIAPETNLLVVVDQFEELFRFRQSGVSGQEAASAFVKLLLSASDQSELPIYVAITMRSDYLGDCSQVPGLAEAVNDGEYLIPRLSREQRRAAIEKPVSVGGATIAHRLVQRLLNDVGDDADQLPVLQHALMRIWDVWAGEGHHDAPLDLAHYERVGGLQHALSLHADEVYGELPDERSQLLCARLFKALTERGADNRGIRRPTRLERLCAIVDGSEAEMATIVEAFRRQGRTFLMPMADVELAPQTVIDISHESLMRVWQRLDRWVEEESQSARIYRRLADTASLHAEKKAGLFHDPDLQIALSWRESAEPTEAWGDRYHSGFQQAMVFLDASQEAALTQQREREVARQRELEQAKQLAEAQSLRAEEQQRAARRLKGLVAVVAVVACLAFVAFGVAMVARQQAQANALTARQNEDKAKKSEGNAVAAAQNAERERRRAEGEQQRAEREQGRAQREQARAEVALADAQQQRELTRKNLYAAQMAMARGVAQTPRGVQHMRNLLGEWRPAPGLEDLRGWEWYYLKSLYQGERTIEHLGGSLLRCAVQPGGGLLAYGDQKGAVVLWDLRSNTERQRLIAGTQPVLGLQWNGAGSQLAIGCDEGVRLLDTNTGLESALLASEPVLAISWSNQQEKLAAATVAGRVLIWDTATGRQLTSLGPYTVTSNGFFVCEWSPVGPEVLVSSGTELWIVNTESGIARLGYRQHAVAPWAASWHPSGAKVASSGQDGLLHIWDAQTGESVLPIQRAHTSPICSLRWSPNGTQLAVASFDDTISIRQTNSGAVVNTLRGHDRYVFDIAWLPSGRHLVSTSFDQTVRLWDLARQQNTLVVNHGAPVTGLSWSPDSRQVASLGGSQVRIWDLAATSRPRALSGNSAFVAAAWSPDGKWVATSSSGDGGTTLWNAKSGRQLTKLRRDGGGSGPLAWDRTGRWLAQLGRRGQLRSLVSVWDLTGFDNSERVVPQTFEVGQAVAFTWSPDSRQFATGQTVAFGSSDPQIVVWDLEEGRRAAEWIIDSSTSVQSIDWSPDGARIIAGGGYNTGLAGSVATVSVWNVESGEEEFQVQGHSEFVRVVAWSPDGRRFISTSRDQTCKVWDLETRREVLTLSGDFDYPDAAAWSPDGTRIAVGSLGRTVHVYDSRSSYLADPPDAMLPMLSKRIAAEDRTDEDRRARAAIHARQGRWDEAAADLAAIAAAQSERAQTWYETPWWVVGPYPAGLEGKQPPELEPNPLVSVPASPESDDTQQLDWKLLEVEPHQGIRFEQHFVESDFRSFYCYKRVYAPRATQVGLLIGSDDRHRLWLNGELVHEVKRQGQAFPDEDAALTTLREGWNTILVKVENIGGTCALYFRLSDDPVDIARALETAGRKEEALAQWDRAVERSPNKLWLLAERARSAGHLNQDEKALADMTAIIERASDNVPILRRRADLLRKQGRWDQVAIDYSRLSQLRPDDWEWRYQIGRMFAHQGQEVVVSPNSRWRWRHARSDPARTDRDFHTTFYRGDYDDSSWSEGRDSPGDRGGFGYGEPAGVNIGTPTADALSVAYFRHRFRTQRDFDALSISLQRDDGVIIYLDGVEVARDNIGPAIRESFSLLADDAAGSTVPRTYALKEHLPAGDHLLAISLHNRSASSSDLRIGEISLLGRPVDGSEPLVELTHPAELIGRGLALHELGKTELAAADLEAARKLAEDTGELEQVATLFDRSAAQSLDQGDVRGALAATSQAARAQPSGARYLMRGRLHARTRQWQAAADDLAKAIELNPDDIWAWYQRSPLLVLLGQTDEYRTHCRDMMARFGDSAPESAGRALQGCLFLPDAVADWDPLGAVADRALNVSANLVASRQSSKGAYLYRAGKFVEAAVWINRGLNRQTPAMKARSQAFLAMAYQRSGFATLAQRALRDVDSSLSANEALLSGDDLGGQWHDWITTRLLRREAAALVKGPEFAWFAEAEDLSQDGAFDLALERLTAAIAKAPDNREFYLRRATVAQQLQRWEDAGHDLSEAAERSSGTQELANILRLVRGPLLPHVKGVLALQAAVWNGQPRRLAALLQAENNADGPGSPSQLLLLAVFVNRPEVAKVLLQRGADVDVRDSDGATPLHLAARQGQYGVVRVLLEADPDVNAVDRGRRTPLHAALESFPSYNGGISPTARSAIVGALLQRKPDLEIKDRRRRGPLDRGRSPQNRALSLAEVQVFSADRNIATEGTATQSSVHWGGLPERAIDGDTNGEFADNSVSHTADEIDPWWELDLGEQYQVDRIAIWDRTPDEHGSYRYRLANYRVQVLDDARQTVWETQMAEDPQPSHLHLPRARGRYVRITAPSTEEGLWNESSSVFYARSQAWPLRSAGDLEGAIAQWSVVVKHTPDDTQSRMQRALLAGRTKQWDMALTDMKRLMALEPENDYHCLRAAPLFLMAGDLDGYRRFRSDVLARFEKTDKALVADKIAKSCLLLPDVGSDAARITALAAKATVPDPSRGMGAYYQTAQAMASLRAGDDQAAIATIRKNIPNVGNQTGLRELNEAVLALAQLKAGQTAAAREIAERMRPRFDALLAGDDLVGWHDRLIPHILWEELKAQLESAGR